MNIFVSDILFYIFGVLAIVFSLMVVFMRNPVSSAMMMALSFGSVGAIMIGLGAHFLGILQILVYAGAIMVLFSFIIMLLNVKEESSPFRHPWIVGTGVVIAALFIGQLSAITYTLPNAKEYRHCPFSGTCEAISDLAVTCSEEAQACPSSDCPKKVCVLPAEPAVGAPLIKLPALQPKESLSILPEGSTIRQEIEQGEFPDTALLGSTLYSKYNRVLLIAGLALLVASIGVVVLSRRPSGK